VPVDLQLPPVMAKNPDRWIATGNQLAGLGALESGIRFVAAYPITPASDSLEWIARHIESVGGHLVQAEDELAAINMAIGGGYSGVPSMTATSGPGLSLMCEAMGLAVASETPVVILNVMRGGPSTGIPTKSEQSDLNLALYGLHGDAPHIVLSALSVEDCFATVAWANHLALALQTLVIVLSDQFIGQSSKIIEPLGAAPFRAERQALPREQAGDYQRYALTPSGVSPMAVPGDPNAMYTADGLEHSESAVPSPKAIDHEQQLAKRQRKLSEHDYGDHWAEITGEGDRVLLCWGSLQAAAIEASDILKEQQGISVKVVAIRLLMPLPENALLEACAGASQVYLVEQNHQGQCARYLRSLGLPGLDFVNLAKPGPGVITPAEICEFVMQAGGDR
jgi:2-oxoglutarate ferredoxin oxidoreductase subunit alpha